MTARAAHLPSPLRGTPAHILAILRAAAVPAAAGSYTVLTTQQYPNG